MMKVVYVMFKKAGMSRKEFRGCWKDTHAPIAKEMPGLKGYVQNHALVDPEGNEPPYDGFDELYFESQEAMEEAPPLRKVSDSRRHSQLLRHGKDLGHCRRRGEGRLDQERRR